MTGTPANVTNVRTGDYTIELSWSVPVNSTPSTAGYEVFYAQSGSDVTQSGGTTTSDTTTINVTLPKLSATYHLFVVAFSDTGNALPSAHSENSTVVVTEMGLFKMKVYSAFVE